MNVLITAGGTHEDIDSVRCITNKATGRLGSIIADTFAKAGWQITYVCGEAAAMPACDCLELIKVGNVEELITVLEALLHKRRYDCVIHSMAVSDFTPQGIISIDEMVEAISHVVQSENIPCAEMSDRIRSAIALCEKPLTSKKISSKAANVALLLKQTPKVIQRIKSIQPDTLLVGFKLLSNVPEEELLQAGLNLLKQNACDFVLANDLADINNHMHKAILIDKKGILGRASTKQEISKIIFEYASERITDL